MSRAFISSLLLVVACGPAMTAERGASPTFRAEGLDDHELKEELRWAAVHDREHATGLLGRARDSRALGDWEDVFAAAEEIVERHPDSEQMPEALWLAATAATELHDDESAERALYALLCREAAADPVLSGALPPMGLRGASNCTVAPGISADIGEAWLLLGEAERRLIKLEEMWFAFEHASWSGAPGSPTRSRALAVLSDYAAARRNRTGAFDIATTLIDEGGRAEDVELAMQIAAEAIADEDWNGDGRKDAQSGATRPAVARWLRRGPDGAPFVLSRAVTAHIARGECRNARRLSAHLSRLPSISAETARAHAQALRGCGGP